MVTDIEIIEEAVTVEVVTQEEYDRQAEKGQPIPTADDVQWSTFEHQDTQGSDVEMSSEQGNNHDNSLINMDDKEFVYVNANAQGPADPADVDAGISEDAEEENAQPAKSPTSSTDRPDDKNDDTLLVLYGNEVFIAKKLQDDNVHFCTSPVGVLFGISVELNKIHKRQRTLRANDIAKVEKEQIVSTLPADVCAWNGETLEIRKTAKEFQLVLRQQIDLFCVSAHTTL